MYCTSVNLCVINSHEQNIQFLHDSLQEQLEHDFGHKNVLGGELTFTIIFGLFCARFMSLFTKQSCPGLNVLRANFLASIHEMYTALFPW